MSMQSYPYRAHLIAFTPEHMKTLGLEDAAKPVFEEIDKEGTVIVLEMEELHVGVVLLEAFQKKYNVLPYFIYIDDEAEGFSGASENGQCYLAFDDCDKYTMKVKPEWAALPIQPEESNWSNFG